MAACVDGFGTETFFRDTHDAIQKGTELWSLYWLGKIIRLNIIGRKSFNGYFPAVDTVINVKVSDVDMFCVSGTWFTAVILQQYCTLVVLIEDGFIDFESLVRQEILRPHHLCWGVIHSKNFALGGAGGIDFLFLGNPSNTSLIKGHSSISVTLKIIVNTTWRVDLPTNCI